MQRITPLKQTLSYDSWSKLIDGILAAVILYLTWLVVALSTYPIQSAMGMPGLLVYILGLLSIAMYALQQSLLNHRSEPTRAWFGVTAGLMAWAVVRVSTHVGVPISFPGSVILLIMVTLIVALFWRTVLPIGARFFCLTFLLNWIGYTVMTALSILADRSPIFALSFRATGYLSLLGVALVAGWILLHSRRRIHRISAALAVWFLLSVAMYVFQGPLV